MDTVTFDKVIKDLEISGSPSLCLLRIFIQTHPSEFINLSEEELRNSLEPYSNRPFKQLTLF